MLLQAPVFSSAAPKSKSISLVASESDEEFSSDSDAEGEGEEEVDVGGVEDYYQEQPGQKPDRVC